MLSKIIKNSIIVLLLVGLIQPVQAATRKQLLCLDASGQIQARKKCLSTETVFNIATLTQQISQSIGGTSVGPKGPTGNKGAKGDAGVKGAKGLIDFSACRVIIANDSNFLTPSDGDLSTIMTCDPNSEFLFDEEYKVTALPNSIGTTAYIQSNSSTTYNSLGDTRRYEVSIYANRDKFVGAGMYQLQTRAICCPR
jgi:hypothetical protein